MDSGDADETSGQNEDCAFEETATSIEEDDKEESIVISSSPLSVITTTQPDENGDVFLTTGPMETSQTKTEEAGPVDTFSDGLHELSRKLSTLTPATLERERSRRAFEYDLRDSVDAGKDSAHTPASRDTAGSQPQTPSFFTEGGAVADGLFRVFSGKRSRPRSATGISRSDSYNSLAEAGGDARDRRCSLFNSASPGRHCESRAQLDEYVKELGGSHRKTDKLVDILVNSPWFPKTPNLSWQGGVTVLHAAVELGELKVVTAIAHIFASRHDFDIDVNLEPVLEGSLDTPLHLAARMNNRDIIETLLKHGGQALRNSESLTPIQVAAEFLNQDALEAFFKYDCDHTVLSKYDETLVTLACRTVHMKHLNIKDQAQALEAEVSSITVDSGYDSTDVEATIRRKEEELFERSFPLLSYLLVRFKKNPDLLEKEDKLDRSLGMALHYFAYFNFIEGAETILEEPFLAYHSAKNKAGFTPLWLASHSNFTEMGKLLLSKGADPNVQDPVRGLTPLHCAIYGYHTDRVDETCDFIDQLLTHGANPHFTSKSGETAPLLAIGTNDFHLISKFLDHVPSQQVLEMRDESGNSLFHYAVGCLDELSILKLIEMGADLMATGNTDGNLPANDVGDFDNGEGATVSWCDDGYDDFSVGSMGSRHRQINHIHDIAMKEFSRQRSNNIANKLPVQEAMKSTKSAERYFNALRRMDWKAYKAKTEGATFDKFVCVHLVCATREVRPDIVRLLFQNVTNTAKLHQTLLYCDPASQDDTLTKTALEWAVENNDRLCTTEILHQEYECHKDSKRSGLNCLRDQLTGDELLMWTIETFNAFYPQTFAQKYFIPLMGLFPLLLSIATFVYDYYSDIELTIIYHAKAFAVGVIEKVSNLLFTLSDNSSTPLPAYEVSPAVSHPFTDAFKLPPCPTPTWINDTHYLVPKSLNCSWAPDQIEYEKDVPSGVDMCRDFERTSSEYKIAFYTNITCVVLPILISYAICVWELKCILSRNFPWYSHMTPWKRFFPWTGLLLIGIPFAPFFILYVAIRHVIFKFQHQRAIRKNEVRRQLQKSEYYWGILRTVEAGLESCGQLILQVWLLSSDFKKLNQSSFPEILDMTWNGMIFFLSFSAKPASEIEKSLGKLFMSLMALVFGVSACYRTLKRGSVGIYNQFFIYLSLFLQIFARIFSIGLFFFAVPPGRNGFWPNLPLMICIHILIVLVLKFTFERTVYSNGMAANLVALVNVAASTIVYVRIVPIEKSGGSAVNSQQHSTCFIQSIFFILIITENLVLSSWPLISDGRRNRAVACLGEEKIFEYIALVFFLTLMGWLCHAVYYRTGHPWADINGPTVEDGGIHIPVHHWGTESVLSCGIRRRHSSDNPVATEDSDNESDNERADHPNKASLQAQPSICWNSRLYIQFERASNRRQQKPQYQTVQTAVV